MPSKQYMKEYRRKNNPSLKEKEELAQNNKKRCTKCKNIKKFEEFGIQKIGFMGLKAQCLICDKKYDKQFQLKSNYRNNRDKTQKAKTYRKKYINDNKEWWKEYERTYRKNRREIDPYFKIKSNFSSRISDIIKGRSLRTEEAIGCSKEEFIKYIEKLFKDNMNWDNYGKKGWVVDHIIPVSKFDLTKEEEIKKCFHYTNLQPLWWDENLKKFNH